MTSDWLGLETLLRVMFDTRGIHMHTPFFGPSLCVCEHVPLFHVIVLKNVVVFCLVVVIFQPMASRLESTRILRPIRCRVISTNRMCSYWCYRWFVHWLQMSFYGRASALFERRSFPGEGSNVCYVVGTNTPNEPSVVSLRGGVVGVRYCRRVRTTCQRQRSAWI